MPKKKTPKPEIEATAADLAGALTFPTRPRFTLETLREIRIATGDGDCTIAEYTHLHNGTLTTKYVEFSDLTHAEREAALEFILRYSGAAAIRRKGKPRGRAVAGRRAGKARKRDTLTESELRDLDNLDFGNIDFGADMEKAIEEMADFTIPDIDPAPLELTDGDSDPTAAPLTLTDRPATAADQGEGNAKRSTPKRRKR